MNAYESDVIRGDLTLSEYTSLKSLIEKEIIIFDELFEEMQDNSETEFDARPLLIDALSKQMTLIQGMKSITSGEEKYNWCKILWKKV